MKTQYNIPCSLAQALNVIGDKWTLLILHEIMLGNNTYKQLQDRLEGIPTNLLSERLKCLEQNKLLKCELYQAHPPRYQYLLTDSSMDLSDVFNSLLMWGDKNLEKCHKQLKHKACDHKIVHQYYCPHCNKVIEKEDIKVE
jgi:DNA-binding HxlR family transcriptional regulator